MAHPARLIHNVNILSTSQDITYTRPGRGFLHAVKHVPEATTPWAATADVKIESTDGVVVAMTSAVQLTTAGWMRYPRGANETAAGATTGLGARVPIVDQRLQITVLNVIDDAMPGSFELFIDGEWYTT